MGRAVLGWVVFVGLVAAAGTARAQDVAAAAKLRAEGEALGREKRFDDAIARFRAADAAAPAAQHDCLIALAYRRLDRVSLAVLHLDRCLARARAGDPAPSWAATTRDDLAAQLTQRGLVRVEVAIAGDDAARFAIDGWPDGEWATAGPLWITPGRHLFRVTPTSGPVVERTVSVSAADSRIHLDTRETVVTPVEPPLDRTTQPDTRPAEVVVPPPEAPAERDRPRARWPWLVAGGGAALIAVGGAFHLLAADTREDLETSAQAWDDNIDTFRFQRAVAIGGYAAGAAALGAGVWLLLRDDGGGGARVSGAAGPDGASVFVEWSL